MSTAMQDIMKPSKGKTPIEQATIKQRRWLKEYIKSGNATDAARKAGYKTSSTEALANIGWENVRKLDIAQLFEEAGITDAKLASKVLKGLDATTKGQANWNAQFNHLQLAYKLKGKLVDKQEISGTDGDPIKIQVVAGFTQNETIEGEIVPTDPRPGGELPKPDDAQG